MYSCLVFTLSGDLYEWEPLKMTFNAERKCHNGSEREKRMQRLSFESEPPILILSPNILCYSWTFMNRESKIAENIENCQRKWTQSPLSKQNKRINKKLRKGSLSLKTKEKYSISVMVWEQHKMLCSNHSYYTRNLHASTSKKLTKLNSSKMLQNLAIVLMGKIIRLHMLILVWRTTRNDLFVNPCSGFWQPPFLCRQSN